MEKVFPWIKSLGSMPSPVMVALNVPSFPSKRMLGNPVDGTLLLNEELTISTFELMATTDSASLLKNVFSHLFGFV
ncbi:MAG TPA: hypothetical protein PK971_06320, partial [Saprospiraceae bacterium]|nr:hypothetical protein [Saprospiraceae bacterium]